MAGRLYRGPLRFISDVQLCVALELPSSDLNARILHPHRNSNPQIRGIIRSVMVIKETQRSVWSPQLLHDLCLPSVFRTFVS